MLVAGGSTDVTTHFALRLTADGKAATGLTITGFDLTYVRSGVAPVAKVDATALVATDSAHADNKAIEIDGTNQPGLYRVDWPDAAFAAGVREVVLTVKVATAFTEHLRVEIDGEVNVVEIGGTDVVLSAGLLDVNIAATDNVALTAQQKLDVNTEADTALTGYNGPTSAELVSEIDAVQTDIAALNDPTVAAIADAVWDELVTGAAHTTNNSAGKRLRLLAESGSYADGAVWIDTVNGATGTEDFEHGTEVNPVKTIGEANTIAASVGLSRFRIFPGSSITFAATQNNQVFIGVNWTLALGGQDIAGTHIMGANVSGIAAGTGTTQIFHNCLMGATSHIKGTHILTSGISGTQTVVEAGDFFFDRCHSAIAGSATWIFEFGNAIGNTNLNMRSYSGGVQLESMGDTGTDTASIEGFGQIIEGTCAGGAVTVRGMFTISGITNITLTDDARIDVNQIGDVVLDEALAGHTTAGSLGKAVADIPTTAMRGTDSAATATNLATVDTVVDAIKVVTDKMVFSKANELDANTKSINDAEVVGDGNASPWDGV